MEYMSNGYTQHSACAGAAGVVVAEGAADSAVGADAVLVAVDDRGGGVEALMVVVVAMVMTVRPTPSVDMRASAMGPSTLAPGSSPPSHGLARCAILIWISSACVR